jgi:Ca2+:H+ antiporter
MDHPGAGADGAVDQEKSGPNGQRSSKQLPMYNNDGHEVNHAGHKVTPGIQPDGESGRSWFHPWHFVKICWQSSCTASRWTNVLWPFTLAAMILHFGFRNEQQEGQVELWIFITSYIGMVPAANLVGFAGQEMARKLPKVAGVMLETTFGSIVEIVLFTVLIVGPLGNEHAPVIRAAILGSILANMLLCLGETIRVGRDEQD